MRSQFSSRRRTIGATAASSIDETYDLRGLNLTTPDAIMPDGQTPFTINSRMYAREDGETRVANRTRKGAGFLSVPIGEALSVQNVTTATGDIAFSTTTAIAQPFTPDATKPLTRLDVELKKAAGTTGHIIIEIYTSVGGVPGRLVAQSSVLSSLVGTSYAYATARFIQAPILQSSTQYWQVYYIQDNGTGSYYLHQTAVVGTPNLSSNNANVSWNSVSSSIRYKTYLSTAGGVKGYAARYPSTNLNRIMMAHGNNIYQIPKDTGITTSIDSGLDSSATEVRFDQWDDNTMYVNSFNKARWWNPTDGARDIQNVPSLKPKNIIVWQNRVFMQTDVTRYDFSALSNPESWPSVNFFYVPSPKSPDHVTGHLVFQDNLTIFTHETKHIIMGSDISSFTRKEAVGTKGAVSQKAIVSDRNYVYFMADDKQIYRWNSVSDQLLSERVSPELNAIADPTKVRLHLYRNQLRVYYAKSPDVENNRMLLLDLEMVGKNSPFGEWFMDTEHAVSGSMELYLDNNELVEFSSKVGAVYFGEVQGSDLGLALDYKFWTNYKNYGSGAAKKRIKKFRPIIRTVDADYTLLVGKDMDFARSPDMRQYIVSGGGVKWGQFVWGDGSTWGQGVKQISAPAGMSGRGNHIQYRFERKGVETPVELYGYISQYKVGKPK